MKHVVNDSNCTVEHSIIGTGVHQLTCWWRDHFAPVGYVWFMVYASKAGTVAMVTDSYVPAAFRRGGVRTLLNRHILKQAKIIMTSDASEKEGMAFMKGRGYRHVKNLGLMVKR
jgi:hypothetical protein